MKRLNRSYSRSLIKLIQTLEQQSNQLFFNNHTPMLLIDPESGQIVKANPAAGSFYGWSIPELTNKRISEINLLPPDQTLREMKSAFSSAGNQVFFFQHRLANGSVRDVEVHSSPIQIGDKQYLISIILDITERKKADQELRSSEQRLSWALQVGHGGAWDWDLLTGEAWWSSEMYELWGVDPGHRMATDNSFNLISDEDKEHVREEIERGVANRTDIHYEFRIRHSTLGDRWMETFGRPVYDQSGRAVRIIGITFDITSIKLADQALREAHKQAAWLARLPEENPNPVARISFDGIILYQNSAVENLTGSVWKVGQTVPDEILALIKQAVTEREEVQQDIRLGSRYYLFSVMPFPGEEYANIYGRDITDRKNVEEALRHSEATLAQAGAMAQLGAWEIEFSNTTDLNANPLRWSDEVYRIFGYTPGQVEVTNELFYERVHPDDRQKITEAISRAIEEHQPYEIEHRIICPDGSERIVYEHAQIAFDDQNNPLLILGAIQDITDRKRTEEALRESEARFRQLANSMPQLVWTARADGTVDYYNRRYSEFGGISPISRGVWMWGPVLHEEDFQRTQEAWRRAIETGETYQIEHRIRMADGSFRWHLSRGIPVRDARGKVTRWYGTATDIHETKMAEVELINRNERLALLSDTASRLLTSSDPGQLISEVYNRLSGLIGLELYIQYNLSEDGTHLELSALSGFSDEDRMRLEILELGQAICGVVAETRQSIVVSDVQNSIDPQIELIRSMGITAYTCHPLIVQDRLIGTLSFGTRSQTRFDPSSLSLIRTVCDLVANAIDRKRAEITLQAYAGRLEQSNRDLQEFAYVASHDLQEPLRKIEAFGDSLIHRTGKLDEQQRDYLERMRNAANRMRNMVESLLQLSRLTTLAQPFVSVDLSIVAHEVISDLDHLVQRTGGRVEVYNLPVVAADPLQMRLLLQNLIGNALKFHQTGVSPLVKLSSNQLSGTLVQVLIEDNGIGFDDRKADKIFQPFQRLVGRSEFEGSGMGLAICRRIVERHGGEIAVRSKPGQGATFVVTLPVVKKDIGGDKAYRRPPGH